MRLIVRRGVRLGTVSAVAIAAFGCAARGTSYTFRVMNRDTMALDSVVITGGDVAAALGSILPGSEASRTIVVRQSVLLHLNGLRGDRPVRVILGGYLSPGPDADVIVTVTSGGGLRIGAVTPR
jgi:hypothetical protein